MLWKKNLLLTTKKRKFMKFHFKLKWNWKLLKSVGNIDNLHRNYSKVKVSLNFLELFSVLFAKRIFTFRTFQMFHRNYVFSALITLISSCYLIERPFVNATLCSMKLFAVVWRKFVCIFHPKGNYGKIIIYRIMKT